MATNQLHRGVSLIQRESATYLRWKDPRTQKRKEQRLPDGLTKKEKTRAAMEQKAKLDAIARRVATGEVREIEAGVDLVAEWVADAPSPQTGKNRQQTATLLYKLQDLMGHRGWDELVLEDLIRFRQLIAKAHNLTGSTKNLRIQQARSFFTYLRRLGHRLFLEQAQISDALVKFRQDPYQSGELLSPDNLQRLFIKLHKRDADLGLFSLLAVTCGARIGELIQIRGADFVFEKGKAPVLKINASKTGKMRIVSLKASPLAVQILVGLKHQHGEGLLFRPQDARTPAQRYEAWGQTLRRTYGVMFKSLRATNEAYLTKTKSFSGDIFAIANNLGHNVNVAQQSYLSASNQLLIENGDSIEGIAKISTIAQAIMQKCGMDLDLIDNMIRKVETPDSREVIDSVVAQVTALLNRPVGARELADLRKTNPEVAAMLDMLRKRGMGNE